ncbi:unnamed protein product [Thelazia callipaeda]|uniref:Zinc finger, CCHC-type n=1 Tax=Thelazia callipaeda TaxID=103827 RepID=A0A0N5CRL3_THECL|nr:unnamed protein product [Thelazia callipaeda]
MEKDSGIQYSDLGEFVLEYEVQDTFSCETEFGKIAQSLIRPIGRRRSLMQPITCVSNPYKLITKCVALFKQLYVAMRRLLADNQLGTVTQVQGSIEQALLNLTVCKKHGNQLYTTWYDIKKALGSVNYRYLIKCIERLNVPSWSAEIVASEVNPAKSANNTSTEVCADKAAFSEGTQEYKYLGIVKDRTSAPTRENLDKLRAGILARIKRLARTAPNGKNFIKAVNEKAISLINYYIEVLEPEDFKAIDHGIRQLLNKYEFIINANA